MVLTLRKMGLDFQSDWSDCGNHRLRIENIETRSGKVVTGDFLHGPRWDFLGDKPKKISDDRQMFADLCYTDERGCWGYHPYKNVTDIPYYGKDFTLQNILDYVNSIAVNHYDSVEVV